uniref:Uncharacterized protein n=1 Tax=Arundo donax TaxID=35708 RepID=A0A0A8ZB91_ARUDO
MMDGFFIFQYRIGNSDIAFLSTYEPPHVSYVYHAAIHKHSCVQ